MKNCTEQNSVIRTTSSVIYIIRGIITKTGKKREMIVDRLPCVNTLCH